MVKRYQNNYKKYVQRLLFYNWLDSCDWLVDRFRDFWQIRCPTILPWFCFF